MPRIIAIGGGEIADHETLSIDDYIVQSTNKKRPNALFIPTASGEPKDYCETFRRVYDEKLGCATDVLLLIKPQPSEAIAAKIAWADLIYVGGGNTLRMMKLWRKRGVDDLLRQAHQRGTVLSGLSAGAVCWFAYGHSDSRSFAGNNDNWQYIRVRGMRLVDAMFCPHIDGEKRLPSFRQAIQKFGHIGIGMDNCAAIEIMDDGYRVLASRDNAKGYRVYRRQGKVAVDPLLPSDSYQPVAESLG